MSLVCGFLLLLSPGYSIARSGVISPIAYAFVLLALIQWLYAAQSYDTWRRTIRPLLRFLDRKCPDCDYDLASVETEAKNTDDPLATRIGPRHCPECGALWPLIPPDPAQI